MVGYGVLLSYCTTDYSTVVLALLHYYTGILRSTILFLVAGFQECGGGNNSQNANGVVILTIVGD